MPANTAYATSQSQLGIGIESTRGTVLTVPTFWLPYMSPEYVPNIVDLDDKGLRGSPVDSYDIIPGPRYDSLAWKGNPFLDSFPVLVRALLGSTDHTTAAPTSTTLTAGASAGATTISTTGTIAVGSWIAIGSGLALEAHKTTAVSGAGPFSVTLAVPLDSAQPNGATVTGLTAHKFGLLADNSVVGNQPPQCSLFDFDGEEWRQIGNAQLDMLNIKGATETLLEYDTKFVGNSAITPATPTFSNPATTPPPGWTLVAQIAGSSVSLVDEWECGFSRGTKPVPGSATGQSYYISGYAGPLASKGKLTLIEQSGATEIGAFLNNTIQSLDLTFTDLANGDALNIHYSSVKFRTAKLDRGKEYVQVPIEFFARPNATDTVQGGLSPVAITIANGQSSTY